ncbi:riboflavin synthase [Dongia deserti]|uniref:riboflavin synthase n=1 Tax=Dongia deserti TaxID=2268030 RepID=UPI000E64A6E0|nr:riboflavin synthase [Dongia deserti]
MFTGIITDLGKVKTISFGPTTRLEIATAYDTGTIPLGASIACNGCCLSVVEKGPGWMAFEASRETLDKTTMADWKAGLPINLERALKLGDELGGHLVSGHVDGVGRLVSIKPDGGSQRMVIEAPAEMARMIAPKGSIVVDGISLTVNEVDGTRFGVNIIPITQTATNLGQAREGDRVNLEIDLIARYVARLLAPAL